MHLPRPRRRKVVRFVVVALLGDGPADEVVLDVAFAGTVWLAGLVRLGDTDT